MGHNLETRSFSDEVRSYNNNAGNMFDLGHPLLNRIAGSFVTAAGVCFLLLMFMLFFSLFIVRE